MNSHVEWTPVIVAALVAWWTVVIAGGLAMRRAVAHPVTLEVTLMSHRRTWLPAQRAALWRRLSWLAFVAGLDGASLRAARRAERIERRTRQRARAAERESARALDWDRTLGSSRSSATILPPAAPRPALDFSADENTRRWERTLPWGTPSPLMTREGRGKPYPFVPLSPYRTAAPVQPEPRRSPACTPGCPSHNVPRIPMGAFEAPPLPTSSSRRARRNP